MPEKAAPALRHPRWLLVLLLLCLFIPPVVAHDFDARDTSAVVHAVLVQPMVTAIPAVTALAKYLLLGIAVVCLLRPTLLGRLGWGYYAAILLVMAFGQNMAVTDRYGFTWLIGNTAIQLIVAAFAAADAWRGWTRANPQQLRRRRLWVLALSALAWLFPYVVVGQDARVGFTLGTLVNESGLTYCMVTPVVLSLMILYVDGVHRPTLMVVAWAGLLFGVTNTVTWFALDRGSWWMGVLHLPLLLLSAYALWASRRTAPPRPQPPLSAQTGSTTSSSG